MGESKRKCERARIEKERREWRANGEREHKERACEEKIRGKVSARDREKRRSKKVQEIGSKRE